MLLVFLVIFELIFFYSILMGFQSMFHNLKIHFIGDNEILAYNDVVAAIFNDYRITSNNGVHLLEERKLTDDEMDKLLENLHDKKAEDGDGADEQIADILSKITKICPEVKYMIHGLRVSLARTPQRIEKKQKKFEQRKDEKQKRKEEQRKSREIKEEEPESKPEPEPEKKPIDVDYGGKAKDRDKESQDKRYEEEEKMKQDLLAKEKEDKEGKEEEEPGKFSKVGKPKYTGFLGLLYNMFKAIPDPQNKAEREALQKKLRQNWATYKKNEKFLKENKQLVEMLEDKIEKKQIDPDSIAIMNEIIARDPTIVKEFDFAKSAPDKVQLPLKKFDDILKGLKLKSSVNISKQVKDYFKKEKININSVKVTDDVDDNKRVVDLDFDDWGDFLKMTNLLALKHQDIR